MTSNSNFGGEMLAAAVTDADPQATQILSYVRNKLNTGLFSLHQLKGEYRVRGRIPLLTETKISMARLNLSSTELAAAVLVECAELFENQSLSDFMDVSIFSASIRYLNGGTLPGEFRPYFQKRELALSELEVAIKAAKKTSDEQTSAFEKRMGVFLHEKSEDIDAFKRSVGESMRFGAASDLWREKANSHRWGFYVWFIIFTICTGGVGWYLVNHIQTIADSIPKDKDGVVAYSSLIFFIVPVVAFAWVLRLMSRFINNQLILSDDARHRDVMTKTYLALVAEKNSQVDERDRLIMLSAIFRPLPGAQMEDVAPPTILDLIKKP